MRFYCERLIKRNTAAKKKIQSFERNKKIKVKLFYFIQRYISSTQKIKYKAKKKIFCSIMI